jgi:TPR repeat protein
MGFFAIKSYVDEHIVDRDTERALNYYRQAAKNSMHDCDVLGVRYLVWKHKEKKDKLWH